MASKMTQIYVGIGVVAVLGGLLWVQHKKEESTTNTTYTQGSKQNAPQIKVMPEELDKLTIKAKDKPEVVLAKTDGNWAMAAPVANAKVSKTTVDEMLNALKGLTFKDLIATGPEHFSAYQLEEGKGIHIVASKGGAPVVDLWLGNQKSRGQMARLGSDPAGNVWSVTGVAAWSFDKGPKDVREKKVWELSRDAVTYVELKGSKGTFVFEKGSASGDAGTSSSWLGLKDGNAIAGLDGSKVDDLVGAYTLGGSLFAEDFADGKGEGETGLSANATTLTFRTKEGAASTLTVGSVAEGNKRFARKSGDETIYVIGESPSGWADAGLEKFVRASAGDAGVEAGKK